MANIVDFKNFHRLLCERFNYPHDEEFWWRDQVSLIEHIAKERDALKTELGATSRMLAEFLVAIPTDHNTYGEWIEKAKAAIAELEAALKQEPVGYFYLLDFSDTTIYKDKEGDENYAPLYASPVPAQKGTPAYSCVYCGCLELEKVTACHCLPQGAEQKWNEHMVFPALD